MHKSRSRGNPKNALYRFSEGQYEKLLKIFGYNSELEFNKTINVIETWIMSQNHFVTRNIDRNYIEGMLIGAKGSIEKTKQLLDRRFTLAYMMPDLFTNIDTDTFDNLMASYKHIIIPESTDDHYRVVIGKYSKHNVLNYTVKDLSRYLIMATEYCIMNDAVVGHIFIMDFVDVAISDFMLTWSAVEIQRLMTVLLEGYASKIKSVHLMTKSKIIDLLVTMLKQVLSEKLVQRLYTHTSHESLLQVLPKNLLPSDYGGSQKSINELHEITYKELKSRRHSTHMKMLETYKTDETKRLTLKLNETDMGLPGSFRTLTVD